MKTESLPITPQMTLQERIEEFKKVIPLEFPEELKGDFAAELQWKSWQSHLEELENQLK